MTLIEVLAGLVVLGTVLASVTIARGRFMRQTARAQQKIQATREVDGMIASWLSGPPGAIPVPSQGAIEDAPNMIWQTQWQANPAAESLGAHVVGLRVFDGSSPGETLLNLDFVVHEFREPATQPSGAQ